jgi:hypothetical protein
MKRFILCGFVLLGFSCGDDNPVTSSTCDGGYIVEYNATEDNARIQFRKPGGDLIPSPEGFPRRETYHNVCSNVLLEVTAQGKSSNQYMSVHVWIKVDGQVVFDERFWYQAGEHKDISVKYITK